MHGESSDHLQRPRGTATLILLALVFLLTFGGLVSLGIWQLQRLDWKLDLIERVEARVHAEPVAVPTPADWRNVSRERDEYRRVRLDGHYLPDRDTRVQAVTELGSGYWVVSPFRLRSGDIVLVNRGFVPPKWSGDQLDTSEAEVVGLLRLPEPGGGFLRDNDAASDRWHSRDVQAIAEVRGLGRVAPFFVDAERAAGAIDAERTASPEWPRGGLTVVKFNNHHLGYALTWFALALGVAWAGWRLAKEERKLRASPLH